jgi:hypothetical protein
VCSSTSVEFFAERQRYISRVASGKSRRKLSKGPDCIAGTVAPPGSTPMRA